MGKKPTILHVSITSMVIVFLFCLVEITLDYNNIVQQFLNPQLLTNNKNENENSQQAQLKRNTTIATKYNKKSSSSAFSLLNIPPNFRKEPPDDSNNNNTSNTNYISLILQTTGEMGNNMLHLAAAYAIQILAATKYNISIETIIKAHLTYHGWNSSRQNIQQCFTNFKNVDFQAGISIECDQTHNEQIQLYGQEINQLLTPTVNNFTQIEQSLRILNDLLQNTTKNTSSSNYNNNSSKTISIPHVTPQKMLSNGVLFDMYMNEIVETLFLFDVTNIQCCNILPYPNETVFHYRGFSTELKKRAIELGFEELTPNETISKLFQHLNPAKDSIAILSRFPATEHVVALQEHGFQVREVSQSTVQDFCFMMYAQKGLIGTRISTFFTWAAYLNKYKAPTILYVKDTPSNRRHFHDNGWFNITNHTWSSTDPRQHIRFVIV